MFSTRFGRPIHLTFHARKRLAQRVISEALLLDLIETGIVKYKDARHVWIFKAYADRRDNLLCAATIIADALIIKTVMNHFQPE